VKKVILMPVMALVVLLMITPVMAPATKTSVKGEFFGYATASGIQWTSEEGIVQIRDGAGAGMVTGDIPGFMTFSINAAFDPATGTGRAWGTYVASDNDGNPTFGGSWLMSVSYWGNIEGRSVGHGTGAYEGMLFTNQFWGYNAYFGLPLPPYPKGTPIYFYFEGTIISP